MTKDGDTRFIALDEIRKAMGKIYEAKRAGTATVKDDVALRELHKHWVAVMGQIGDPNHPEASVAGKTKVPRAKM